MNKILIVDDLDMNRELLREILEDEYEILDAADGRSGLNLILNHSDELTAILLDLNMPIMSGYDVLKELGRHKLIDKIPILIISGEQSIESERDCFEYGVTDFIRRPFDFMLVRKRVNNVVQLFEYRNHLEATVEKQTRKLKKQADKLRESNINIIEMLGDIVESRNLESGEHVFRVKGYTKILAEELMKNYPEYRLTKKRIEMIAEASALHDIGKIAIPDDILLKKGRLTDEEFTTMKEHTTRGCDILNRIKRVWGPDYKKLSYDICRHHHEKYDGGGYPDHLTGDDIPIAAQIVSVADVYDALVNERCYKKAFSPETAFMMILNGECGMFNPKLMECFKIARVRFEKFARSGAKG